MEDGIVDYHDFTSRNTSVTERKRLHVGNVWRNEARCLGCDDVVRSRNGHDFRSCKCGNLSIDGGSFYCKREAKDFSLVEEMSVLFDDAGNDG